jgi:hypothetical protein
MLVSLIHLTSGFRREVRTTKRGHHREPVISRTHEALPLWNRVVRKGVLSRLPTEGCQHKGMRSRAVYCAGNIIAIMIDKVLYSNRIFSIRLFQNTPILHKG